MAKHLFCIVSVLLLLSCNGGEKPQVKKSHNNRHEYVDLGLSVCWATTNIGADEPTDFGDYFAWGEVKPNKEYYHESTYKFCKKNGTMFGMPVYDYTKYVTEHNTRGFYDNKLELDAEDDAASVLWKDDWRMPTEAELKELRDGFNCNWIWIAEGNTEFKGVAGFKVVSRKKGYEGSFIFLPAAGEIILGLKDAGFLAYWSKSLNSLGEIYAEPYALELDPYSLNNYSVDSDVVPPKTVRTLGATIRPVKTKKK